MTQAATRGRVTRLLPVALSLLFACGEQLSLAEREHAIQGVRGQVEVWTRAVNNRALDTLAVLHQPGSSLSVTTPDGAVIRGWEAQAARLAAWAASAPPFNGVVDDVEVDVLDQWTAVATFRFTLDEALDRSRRVSRTRVTQVWTRPAPGALWRIRAEHQSRIDAEAGR